MPTSGNVASILQLPIWLNDEQLERAQVLGANWQVSIPTLMQANGKAFPAVTHGVHRRTIQNIGITPIYYWIGNAIDPVYATETPHGILAGCKVALDGTGGQVDLSQFTQAVWVGNPTGAAFDALLFSSYIPNLSGNAYKV